MLGLPRRSNTRRVESKQRRSQVLALAYEAGLEHLKLGGHGDPRAETLAQNIILLAKDGEGPRSGFRSAPSR